MHQDHGTHLAQKTQAVLIDNMEELQSEIREQVETLDEPYDHDGVAGPDDRMIRATQLDAMRRVYGQLYEEFTWRLYVSKERP